MKILHTSDWHLGHQLYGYDRTDEHLHFFSQLKDIVEEETPDVMIVSGDIFDISNPSASCSRMFTDFLLDLHRLSPLMKIIVTSGNHDSASRIDVNRNLWREAGIHVIGTVRKENGEFDFSGNIIKIGDKGTVVAIPYMNRIFMGSGDSGETPEKSFFEKVSCALSGNGDIVLPVVLSAHLTVAGADLMGHKDSTVGNIERVETGVFGPEFDYVALGHIHRPQTLASDFRIRYSGSPVAVSFDEDYPHSVTIAEVTPGMPPVVRERVISQLHLLKTIPDKPVGFNKALKQITKLADDDGCFIRLNVMQETDLPSDCEEQATRRTEGKASRYCTIKYQRPDSGLKRAPQTMSVGEFSELAPRDLAGNFFASRGIGEETAASFLEMISEIEQEINIEKSL